jgi:molecular chaperone GrpE
LTFLKKTLFPETFVIDETPEPIFREEAKPVREGEAGGAAENEAAPAPPWERGGDDLLSEFSRMLLEQVRLEQKAKILEAGKGGDDEFAKFVKQALPFLDNFWRILEMARERPPTEEMKNWLASVESLYFRLVKLLDGFGLVFMNSLGNEVNLDYHEVVEYRPSREHADNQVIKELEKGVVFRGRLLREAKVVVAYHPS